jgi:hypothetical protein
VFVCPNRFFSFSSIPNVLIPPIKANKWHEPLHFAKVSPKWVSVLRSRVYCGSPNAIPYRYSNGYFAACHTIVSIGGKIIFCHEMKAPIIGEQLALRHFRVGISGLAAWFS